MSYLNLLLCLFLVVLLSTTSFEIDAVQKSVSVFQVVDSWHTGPVIYLSCRTFYNF